MKIVIPSNQRLKGSEKVAAGLLTGLLENVNQQTVRKLQELVFDVYVRLKLWRIRMNLIQSASGLACDLRRAFASSLETHMGVGEGKNQDRYLLSREWIS
jgi:hypothetical protein